MAAFVVLIAIASTGAQVVIHRRADQTVRVNEAIAGVRIAVLTAHGAAIRLAPHDDVPSIAEGESGADGGAAEAGPPGAALIATRESLWPELSAVLSPQELAILDERLDGFLVTLASIEVTPGGGGGPSGEMVTLLDQLGASQLSVFQELDRVERDYLSAARSQRGRLLVARIVLTVLAVAAVVTVTSAFTRTRSRAARLAASQAEVARSEERFRSLVQHSSDVIAIYGRDGVVRYLSDSFERVLGRPVAAWVGRTSAELCHPDDRTPVTLAFAQALADPGTPRQVELRLRHADGSWRWFDVVGQAGADPAVVDGVVVNARDITERKALEAERADTERRYRTLVERIPAMTYVTLENPDDPSDYTYDFVSPQLRAMTGYETDDWTYVDFVSTIVHPEDRSHFVRTAITSSAASIPFECEYRVCTRSGDTRWVVDRACLAEIEPDGRQRWQGVILDVSLEKRIHLELEESERRHRALVERTPAITYITEDNAAGPDDYRFAFVSPQVTAITGWTVEEVLATRHFLDLVHPDDRMPLSAENAEASRAGAFEGEYRLLTKTGGSVWVHDSSSLLEVDAEGMERWQGVLIDISEAKRSRLELEAATARFRTLVEQLPAIVYELVVDPADPKGRRFTYVSPAFERIYEVSPDRLMSEPELRFELVHPEDRALVAETMAAALRDHAPASVDFRALTASGIVRWVNDQRAFLSRNPDGTEVWQGLITDVTAAREASASLREAERRYRALVEQLPGVVYEMAIDPENPSGRHFTYISPAIEQLYGFPVDVWMDNPDTRLAIVHPDDQPRVERVIVAALPRREPVSIDFRATTADGRSIWVSDQKRFLSRDADGVETWQGLLTDITASRTASVALREAEQRYRTLVEEVPVVTYRLAIHTVNREDRHYKYLSPQFEHLMGFGVDTWMDDKSLWDQCVHPEDYGRIIASHVEDSNVKGWFDITYRMKTAAGAWFWCREVARRVGIDAEGYALWQGVWMDVTAQKEAELASRDREREFRLLFSSNPQPTWVYDRETHGFLEVNEAASLLYGYGRDTFLTMRVEQLVAPGPPWFGVDSALDDPAAADGRHVQHVTQDGRTIEVELTSHELMFRGRPARLVIALDVTARHALEARLLHQAYHDTLTGLPNRALFADRLQVALGKTRPVAVLFVDLDDFKVINDTLGHEVGDALLLAVGERLQGALRPRDTIARLGGDEFTVLLENADLAAAIRVADRLIAELSGSFTLEGHDVVVSPSIGIALNSSGDEEPEELLRRADVAMYEAKTSGKRRYATFDARMDVMAWQRLELESELRRAIAGDQLTLDYQPIVELATGTVTEVEALVRWRHPVRGLLPPGEFIGIAEQSGLILELDAWVLNAAALQMTRWIAEGAVPDGVIVAVNLSARQFQGQTLVSDVGAALSRTGLPASRLKLEITETVALSDIPATLVMLQHLKALGVSLAIDDFGSGYSGLSYLQRCPIDTVKIDRSYVDGIGVHPGDTAMIRAVMAFARTLGLKVTAEGVETEVQLAELRALSVDAAQGYLFARPMSPDAVMALVRESTMAASLVASG